ncbi:MAG: hypothetical protein IT376_14730 [Polyangiaceae bacterium]|nr:hypothetical protein [Polyangiaceae bacterium]
MAAPRTPASALTPPEPLGSLALGAVRPLAPELGARALGWSRALERIGIRVPFVVVHDLGLALVGARSRFVLGARIELDRLPRGRRSVLAGWRELVRSIAHSETATQLGRQPLADEVVVALLAQLLGAVALPALTPRRPAARPGDPAPFADLEPRLARALEDDPRDDEVEAMGALLARRPWIWTLVDALDLDTLRLFGVAGGDAARGASLEVDLLHALGSPEANDVARFSLDVLPSVLETKGAPGASAAAGNGYAGIGRRGTLDTLVLTELAWDPDELARRVLDDEVLYYAHEHARDDAARVHHLVIDASASMRGARAVFARGMALARGKQLLLRGDQVSLRFFDARLYEAHAALGGRLPVAHVLAFRGARGRHPARALGELAAVLDASRARDPRRPVVHLFTHAALHVPRATVERLRARAEVHGVFLLPSRGRVGGRPGALQLDYLDLLASHHVVDEAVVVERAARADAAREILAGAGVTGPARREAPAATGGRVA